MNFARRGFLKRLCSALVAVTIAKQLGADVPDPPLFEWKLIRESHEPGCSEMTYKLVMDEIHRLVETQGKTWQWPKI